MSTDVSSAFSFTRNHFQHALNFFFKCNLFRRFYLVCVFFFFSICVILQTHQFVVHLVYFQFAPNPIQFEVEFGCQLFWFNSNVMLFPCSNFTLNFFSVCEFYEFLVHFALHFWWHQAISKYKMIVKKKKKCLPRFPYAV